MDKFDLDFLVDSQDANLLYKHILIAICNNSGKVRKDTNMYVIDSLTIHCMCTCMFYSTEYPINRVHTGRIDKYVMEL